MFQKTLKIITTVLLFLVTAHVYGGNGPETTVTCKVYNNTGSAVALYKVENGEAVSLGFRRPGELDTCQFSLTMEHEGIYFIQKPGGKGGAFTNLIYLKPGDNKTIDIYVKRLGNDFDSCIVESPNHETVILQSWTNFFIAV